MEQNLVLHIDPRGPVEWVTLNRPESGNALNITLVEALSSYFEGLRDREAIRIVVLRAIGKHFCTGLDMNDSAVSGGGAQPEVGVAYTA